MAMKVMVMNRIPIKILHNRLAMAKKAMAKTTRQTMAKKKISK